MVKIKRSFPAPQSLAIEKKKVKGSYREADVIERLAKDFNNKCYICELDKLQDPQVEHLAERILIANLIGTICSGHVAIVIMSRIKESMMTALLTVVSQIQRNGFIFDCKVGKQILKQ